MRRRKGDFVILALLAAAGLALRWWRLDLMSFRFDSAEAMFRVYEAAESGFLPLTGIINSLGFRNPPGLIWLIFPAAMATPDPRLSAAVIGFVSLLGLPAVYLTGRVLLRSPAWVLPCVAYVFAPSAVFAGRNIWAQNVVPAFAAWALWWLLASRLNGVGRERRVTLWLASGAMLLWIGLIHFSGLAWLAVWFLASPWELFRKCFPRGAWWIVAILGVLSLCYVPSALDWLETRRNPRPKPVYAQVFEAAMPPPKDMARRIADAAAANFEPYASVAASGGVAEIMDDRVVQTTVAVDWIWAVLCLFGFFLLLLSKPRSKLTWIFFWCIIPPAAGAMLLPRMNPSYSAPVVPAVMILAGLPLAVLCRKGRKKLAVPAMVAIALASAGIYSLFQLETVRALDRNRYVNAVYYIPLAEQVKVARFAAQKKVPFGHLFHMSGDWFARPYEYLHQHVAAAPPRLERHLPCAVVQDEALRHEFPQSSAAFREKSQFKSGNISVAVFPDPDAMEEFLSSLPGS